ncbi:hypothetical protein PUN28_001215 [Cardiocondyla obscurior]|uniref:Uncharacterized protein n=1 Tax=Cardiocondyla obscurior TaxID=286306 RepID=A0AAW2H3W1_9HYME
MRKPNQRGVAIRKVSREYMQNVFPEGIVLVVYTLSLFSANRGLSLRQKA